MANVGMKSTMSDWYLLLSLWIFYHKTGLSARTVSVQFEAEGQAQMFVWGFYVAFNTVQVISWRVVGRAEETSTYSSLGFCTVNCRPTASNYQLSHLRPWRGSNPGRRGGRRECYHSATMAPDKHKWDIYFFLLLFSSLCTILQSSLRSP